MKIGKVTLKNNIFLAPMAGITDIGFRVLANKYGAGLSCTEMVSAAALFYKSKKTELLLEKASKIEAVQLFGKVPEHFAVALKNEKVDKFDIVDINMGCPARKIVSNGEGSALMKNLPLAKEIIETCVKNTDNPVTVKIRLGWNDKTINAVEFAKMAEAAGASAITVHGRTKEQGYSGKADWNEIAKVVNAVKIPVIANGDIKTRDDVKKALEITGAAGVMIGRASFGNPWIFSDLLGKKVKIDFEKDIETHFSLLKENLGEKLASAEFKKHRVWYDKFLKVKK